MLFRKSIEYCVSRQMLSIVITILFKIFAPVLNFNELHIAKIFKYFTKEVSSLLDPLINIILGYQIANLDNNLKKGMMINSKLAFLRSFLRLVIIPLVFIFSILLFKSQIFSLDSQIEDVKTTKTLPILTVFLGIRTVLHQHGLKQLYNPLNILPLTRIRLQRNIIFPLLRSKKPPLTILLDLPGYLLRPYHDILVYFLTTFH